MAIMRGAQLVQMIGQACMRGLRSSPRMSARRILQLAPQARLKRDFPPRRSLILTGT